MKKRTTVPRTDPEKVQLGSSDKFWKLIAERRKQKTISRAKLEQKVDGRRHRG